MNEEAVTAQAGGHCSVPEHQDVSDELKEAQIRISHLEADLNHQTALAQEMTRRNGRCEALAWLLQNRLRTRCRHLRDMLNEQELTLYREVFPGHGE